MEKYFKLVIPFGTSSYFKKERNRLYIHGNAIFIFDTSINKFVHEYLHLKEANFRLTDANMLKTKHYQNKTYYYFRKKYLNTYTNKKPENINKSTFLFLNQQQLNEINEAFKKMKTTIKVMYSCLSGSNISGAETYKKASPLLSTQGKYASCNFANACKTFYANSKQKRSDINEDNLITYTLQQVIDNNIIPDFKYRFFYYNQEFDEENKSLSFNKVKNNIIKAFKIPEKQENFIYGIINNTIDDYQKYYIKRLRSFYKQNITFCINKHIINWNDTNIEQVHIENAHIIAFNILCKQHTIDALVDAICPFNRLGLDANTHELIDKKYFKFNANGDLLKPNNEIYQQKILNINGLHPMTKNYFLRYLKNN